MDTVDREFELALWQEIASWARPSRNMMIDPAGHGLPLVAWMDICADGGAMLTIGVHCLGARIVGDKLHNQLMTLPSAPTAIELRAAGSPQELAQTAGRWFLTLADRGYARQEWVHRGEAYAKRYVVAKTGEPLVESYDHTLAPRRLRAKGPHGVRIREVGEPDRIWPLTVEY